MLTRVLVFATVLYVRGVIAWLRKYSVLSLSKSDFALQTKVRFDDEGRAVSNPFWEGKKKKGLKKLLGSSDVLVRSVMCLYSVLLSI